jgi:hypothetical protein
MGPPSLVVQECRVLIRRVEVSSSVGQRLVDERRPRWMGAARRAGYLPRSNVLPIEVWSWWLLASGFAIADAITTYLAIHGRVGREANPLLGWLIDRAGLMPVLVLRATVLGVGVMGVVALFAACDRRVLRTGARTILIAGTLFWAAVFLNNAALIAR